MAWVIANSNLALVKYWGKSDPKAKHPAGGSLSVTLDGLSSAARVRFDRALAADQIRGLPEKVNGPVREFLGELRSRFGLREHAHVDLASNFPVAAGLASSASNFAALAKAAALAAGHDLEGDALAALARVGSGSACRSVFGGFVEWTPEASGSRVRPFAPADHWPLRILVAVTSEAPKSVSSREGMARTVETSPFYAAWLASGAIDLEAVREAIRARDLSALGTVIERNCMRMHAAVMASDPPLLYWEPATVAVMRRVWKLRADGLAAYFSIDAGPQVKVLCEPPTADRVAEALERVPGVVRVIRSRPGGAPVVVDEAPEWARRALEVAAA